MWEPPLLFSRNAVAVWLVSLFILACENPIEDLVPPSAPRMVDKSVPYAWREAGIDAENDGRQKVKLQWYRVLDEDLAGYRIFRSGNSDTSKFQQIGAINLFQIIGTDTVFYDEEATVGYRYRYCIRSIDNSGNLSEPSDTVSYMLISPPALVSPSGSDTTGTIPAFEWWQHDEQFDFASYFAIRLQDISIPHNMFTIWTCFFRSRWIGESDISFDYFGTNATKPDYVLAYLVKPSYEAGLPAGTYRWKVKRIHTVDDLDRDESGGESEWGYFEVKPDN